jgi:hypothetical protein
MIPEVVAFWTTIPEKKKEGPPPFRVAARSACDFSQRFL